MSGYSIALFVHLLSLLVATGAVATGFQGALALRDTTDRQDALATLQGLKARSKLFPLATLGLLGSGVYMTGAAWTWSAAWIDAGAAGLLLIVILGAGVEAGRLRALAAELGKNGLSERAQKLKRDPVAWTARMAITTLVVMTMFLMTTKPHAADAAIAMAAALAAGAFLAIPFWRAPASLLSESSKG